MNDDQLSRELSRRAAAADVPDVLPAVRSAIDTRPSPVRASRLAPLAGLAGVVAALLLLVIALPRLGPAADGLPSPSGGPVSATTRSGDFSLIITSARSQYEADEPVEVEASLVYDGDQGEATVGGANALIGFGIEQVDGTLRMEPAFDASCTPHTLSAGVPVVEPFSKSGGFSDDDPDAGFWREWFSDPVPTLPAGTWRVKALASFGLDGCRSVRTLEASIVVHVGPEPQRTPEIEAPTPDVAPTPQAPQVISCPPVRDSLGDVAPTVVDETGIVERCLAATPVGGPPATNPEGDLSVLQLEWSGSSCHAAARLSLARTATGYSLDITPTGGLCRMLNAAYAVRLALREPVPAAEVLVTHGGAPELGLAWWELAAHERPTATSTELDLVVYEQACANGESPEGRVVGPRVDYSEEAVTILFWVSPLPGGGDCPLAPGAPVRVELSGPLGDRRIVDGGIGADAVMEASDSLLALETSRVDEMASERFVAMVGGEECTSVVMYDRDVPTQEELEAAAEIPELLDAGEGFIEFGGYVSDRWLSAARAFGAIEAYGGRPKPWYIMMPGERLTLAQLDPFPISGGRTVWFAGFYQAVLGDSQCNDPTQTQPPADPESIPCPSADGRPAEVSIIDHSGLVSGCDAFVRPASPEEFVDVTNVGSDESTLEVRWEIGAICSSMPVHLELWGPFAYEFSGGLPNYALQVEERPTEGSVGCLDVVASQGVRLTLRSSVPAQQIEVFRTSGNRGMGQGRVAEHALHVEIASDTLEFEAGEPIDISALIVYTGPRSEVTLTGFDPNPAFGFQQLDGHDRQGPATHWDCEALDLVRDVALVLPFEKHGVFYPADLADSAAVEAYWAEPELRLPPGLYRFFVRAGGNLNGSCRDLEPRSIGATASIVVTVR